MDVKQGDKAPDFDLLDQQEKRHCLADYKGKWVLLYFYPKDDTPGCTTEACSFRDNLSALKEKNVEVIGVSIDDIKSHQKFVQKYDLTFTLLSDVDRAVVSSYGVWGKKKFMGREYEGTHRVSFLIDPQGMIARVYPKVKPAEHVQEILRDMV